MDWSEWARAPFAALDSMQADLRAIREAVSSLPARFSQLEGFVMATEQESRTQLSGAITGALAAYDQVVRERDQFKAELQTADADAAARVSAALEAEAADDVAFNESQVEELRRLQPAVTPDEAPAPGTP